MDINITTILPMKRRSEPTYTINTLNLIHNNLIEGSNSLNQNIIWYYQINDKRYPTFSVTTFNNLYTTTVALE